MAKGKIEVIFLLQHRKLYKRLHRVEVVERPLIGVIALA
jgi:hypothetical protein